MIHMDIGLVCQTGPKREAMYGMKERKMRKKLSIQHGVDRNQTIVRVEIVRVKIVGICGLGEVHGKSSSVHLSQEISGMMVHVWSRWE